MLLNPFSVQTYAGRVFHQKDLQSPLPVLLRECRMQLSLRTERKALDYTYKNMGHKYYIAFLYEKCVQANDKNIFWNSEYKRHGSLREDTNKARKAWESTLGCYQRLQGSGSSSAGENASSHGHFLFTYKGENWTESKSKDFLSLMFMQF